MDTGPKIAHVASLVGDPSRANMLACLMSGRALTAKELAYVAGVSPQTASGHLAKLGAAGLLAGERQGRHRYFRLASPGVARMLESLMVVAQGGLARDAPSWRGSDALRTARTCYDHMAGRVAVGIAERLVARAHVVLDEDGGRVTEAGTAFLSSLGVDLSARPTHRVFCRPCLDWSERRPHLAGLVGAAFLEHAVVQGWVRPHPDSRVLAVTPAGRGAFAERFGVVAD